MFILKGEIKSQRTEIVWRPKSRAETKARSWRPLLLLFHTDLLQVSLDLVYSRKPCRETLPFFVLFPASLWPITPSIHLSTWFHWMKHFLTCHFALFPSELNGWYIKSTLCWEVKCKCFPVLYKWVLPPEQEGRHLLSIFFVHSVYATHRCAAGT